MRFFLDSNILVSGVAFHGTERSILLASFRKEHELVVSDDVVREALEVMRQKFPRLRKDAEEVLATLRLEAIPRRTYAGQLREFPGLRDPDDAHVLAAAIAARCEAVVTGDRDLLVLGEVEGVRILRPKQAFRLLSGSL